MTPDEMATLYQAAFPNSRPWSAAELAELTSQPLTETLATTHGFAIVRTVVDESELLTIAVAPEHQGEGIGARLMAHWLAMPGIASAFLEVAADNAAALALYRRFGFETVGTRTGYYVRSDGKIVDALTLRLDKSG